jgi:formate--tetrahydrofolate ligase
VLVTTVQSLRNQGNGDLEQGLPNLGQHLKILQTFGLPVVVAINRFPSDTDADLQRLADYCRAAGETSALHTAFRDGGAGAEELARKVVETIERNPDAKVTPVYALKDSFEKKIESVATRIYGASGVKLSEKAQAKLKEFADWGFGELPVCLAKTQYSLTDNPKLLGAPKGWELQVTDATLSSGAGFVVVTAGNMMLMPGLPKASRALDIDVDADGKITGV